MFLNKTSTKNKTFDPLAQIHNNFTQMFLINASTKNKTIYLTFDPLAQIQNSFTQMFLIQTSTKIKLYTTLDSLIQNQTNFTQMFLIKTSNINKTLYITFDPLVQIQYKFHTNARYLEIYYK